MTVVPVSADSIKKGGVNDAEIKLSGTGSSSFPPASAPPALHQVFLDSDDDARGPLAVPKATAVPVSEDGDYGTNKAAAAAAVRAKPGRGFDILLCGDTHMKGRRDVRSSNSFIRLCGNVTVDLRADIATATAESSTMRPPPPPQTLKFFLLLLCGDAKFILPKGMDIVIRRVALCGAKDVVIDEEAILNSANSSSPSATVVVTIVELCGNIRVRNNEEDF